MKILIANKFIYPRGGDCICALELRKLLESKGHEVVFFAMDYPDNLSFPESSYFPAEVSFSGGGLSAKIDAITRVITGRGVEDKFTRLLNDFKPDVVHLHNIHSYLSPVLAKIAHKRGVKVVWTLHDYKLICPSYSCLYKDEVCEACFTDKSQVLKRKCMKNNLIASGLAWVEALMWNRSNLSAWTDRFICPSSFMFSKMSQGGFAADKMEVICNFIVDAKTDLIKSVEAEKESSYCYVGRLSNEKGIRQLLKVASELSYKLYIAGTGPLEAELKEKYSSENITFVGHLDNKGIIELMKKSKFMIIPSICYDNNPLSVIESLCCGTPVLGAHIGGIPELLTDEYSESYQLNNEKELADKIATMFSKEIDNKSLSEKSMKRFSSENYYDKLIAVYQTT